MKKFSQDQSQAGTNREQGFVLLYTVIVVGSLVLTSVLVLFGLTFSAIRMNRLLAEQSEAKYLAEACLEYSLELIRDNSDYTGSGSQTIGGGDFNYNVSNIVNEKRIECVGNSSGSSKKFLVETSGLNPQIEVVSWQEVDSF